MVIQVLRKVLVIMFLIAGIVLTMYPIGKDYAVQYITQTNLQKMSEQNSGEEYEVTYDFEDVTSVTMKDVLAAMNEELPVIGKVSVPSVDLELPIIKGVSNSTMSAGAGTLKVEQEMGQGNYTLASHHMKNPNLLFSPLDQVEIGAKIYLSDSKSKYVYQVIEKKVIQADDVGVIKDKEGQTLVTLITCHESGEKRLIVIGELLEITKE